MKIESKKNYPGNEPSLTKAASMAGVSGDQWLEMSARFSGESMQQFGAEVDHWLIDLEDSLAKYQSPQSLGQNVNRR